MASIFEQQPYTTPSTNIDTNTTPYTQSTTNPYASVPATQSMLGQPYTSSVITSNLATSNITNNTNTLNTANQNLNQPYSSNPAYNVMANIADDTISQTGATNVTNNSTALSGLLLELLGRANSQKESGDYQGMNDTLKEYEEARKARETELTNIYSKLPELRSNYQSSLTKTAQEQQLESQLADIQGQITQYGIDTQTGLYGLEGQGRGIPLGLVRGQQEKLYQQRQLGQQTLQGQESNLLTRLGLEQENRSLATKAAEFGITSLFEDAEITQKAIDAIDSQTNAFMDQVDKLSDNARNTLATIIDKFAGMDMSDLPEESQLQLANLAENAGIDLQTLISGMKANKDAIDFDKAYKMSQLSFDQAYKTSQLGLDQAKLALEQAKAQGTTGDSSQLDDITEKVNTLNGLIYATDSNGNIDTTKLSNGLKKAANIGIALQEKPFQIIRSANDVELASFIGTLEQIISTGTLKSLIDAKAQGATFGALSDRELGILAESFSKIGNWKVKTGDRVIGYNISPEEIAKELLRIKSSSEKLQQSLTGTSSENITNPDGTVWQQNPDGSYTRIK